MTFPMKFPMKIALPGFRNFNRDFLLWSCVRASRHGIPTGPKCALSDQRQIRPRCKMATAEQW